jgi:hypothetical protein
MLFNNFGAFCCNHCSDCEGNNKQCKNKSKQHCCNFPHCEFPCKCEHQTNNKCKYEHKCEYEYKCNYDCENKCEYEHKYRYEYTLKCKDKCACKHNDQYCKEVGIDNKLAVDNSQPTIEETKDNEMK